MKPKLLLIDDNRHLRVTLANLLAHDGFEVMTADSGEQALDRIAEESPDLIILDISMPGMGGMGFLRRIMGSDGRPEYPVLVLTARSAMDSFFGSVPVDGFLYKPCPVSELLSQIRAVLKKRGIRSQERPEPAEMDAPAQSPVLVAEDDDQIREQIVTAFERAGYDVCIACSGPDVIEISPVQPPVLLVLKQLLPKMNGNVVASVISEMPSMRGVPILLYDETRKYEDPAIFAARLPPCVSRYVASNRAHDLVHAAKAVLGG